MKKFFSVLVLGALTLILFNCSKNDDSEKSSNFSAKSGQVELGYVDRDGNFVIYYENLESIKEQWEENFDTEISSFKIEKQLTVDDVESGAVGGEEFYALTATNSTGSTNFAMEINRIDSGFFFNPPSSGTLTITCTSHPSCHCKPASYMLSGKKKWKCVPPCESCYKTEETTF